MADPTITVTILDLPEILELFDEILDAVPDWEHGELRGRLNAILERARRAKEP
jgi:hypothetical protein